jgi:DNA polymerase-3 subunit alpha
MSARFTPLHVHSHYSLLQALPKLPDLVKKAKEEGCEALALTDINNLYGSIDFVMECKKHGIKPILGIDAKIEDNRLILLCENEKGYRNLLRLVTEANLHSGGAMTREMLGKYTDGLIGLGNMLRAETAAQYAKLFPKGNFFAKVAAPEIYYLSPDDRRAWQVSRAIGGIETDGDISGDEEDYFFPSAAMMEEQFSKEELALTNEIAARCTVDLVLGKFVFPEFPLPPARAPTRG